MSKFVKIYLSFLFLCSIVFIVVMAQTFKPVRNVQPDEVMKIEGTVMKIEEGPGFDIVFTLSEDEHYYYINRGMKMNFNLEQLQQDLIGEKVTLYVIERWTIFTRDKNMGHIAKLVFDDHILFNEINDDIHGKTIQ